jgi:N-acetylmuramoyl-L-alanine amidase
MRNLWYILLILVSLSNRNSSVKELDDYYSNLTLNGGQLPEVVVSYTKPSEEDIYLLARLIFCESGYEPLLGKLMVGQVVLNRIKMFNQSLREVIYAKGQFDGVYSKNFYKVPNEESLEASRKVLYGVKILPEDVIYFANIPASTDKAWLREIRNRKYIRILNHTFFYAKT